MRSMSVGPHTLNHLTSACVAGNFIFVSEVNVRSSSESLLAVRRRERHTGQKERLRVMAELRMEGLETEIEWEGGLEGAEGRNHGGTWGNSIPGRKTLVAKGPRRARFMRWSHSKEASVAGDKWVRERAGGSDAREAMKGQTCRARGLWASVRPLDLALGKVGAMGQFGPEEGHGHSG